MRQTKHWLINLLQGNLQQEEHRVTDPGIPALAEIDLHPVIAMATLERMRRIEVPELIARMLARPDAANLLMNQFHLFTIAGNQNFALEMLGKALELGMVYRVEGNKEPAIRLLALMGPGDMADNTPLDYLIEDSDIRLDLLYVVPGKPLPHTIPDHDVAIIALGESGRNRPALEMMDRLIARWPRPVLNQPRSILLCSRDGVYQRLDSIPGLLIPPTLRASRQALERVARPGSPAGELPGMGSYPITVRPLDTQAGEGLDKIENAAELAAYLDAASSQEFFVSFYIDYRSADRLYRKLRIALIDGLPYICHLAIGEHWIVHYKSSDMTASADKRAEEDSFMRDFDTCFALRHREALRLIAGRLALDYVVIDCAETPDGKLLLFEADNRGWVHATDPIDVFPYKQAPMRKVFAAFRAMLFKAAK